MLNSYPYLINSYHVIMLFHLGNLYVYFLDSYAHTLISSYCTILFWPTLDELIVLINSACAMVPKISKLSFCMIARHNQHIGHRHQPDSRDITLSVSFGYLIMLKDKDVWLSNHSLIFMVHVEIET